MPWLRRREPTLTLAACGLLALHALDVGSWQALACAVLLAVCLRFAPPAARAAIAGVTAALAGVTGVLHVLHASWNGLSRTDVTGIALFAAAALLAAACVAALSARPRVRGRRRVLRVVLTTVAAVVLLALVVQPLAIALWLAGKPREPVTATFEVPHRDVTLRTDDGVRLAGWYAPGRTGAAVVLVHGGGGDRTGVLRHARLLARHGFGVLLYDARGRGESGGQGNAMGWGWEHDVRAAVDYLQAQGVRRISALGLSTGAEAVITAAPAADRLRQARPGADRGRRLPARRGPDRLVLDAGRGPHGRAAPVPGRVRAARARRAQPFERLADPVSAAGSGAAA
jgi:uncharacterized protein